MQGQQTEATLFGIVHALYTEQQTLLAALVLATLLIERAFADEAFGQIGSSWLFLQPANRLGSRKEPSAWRTRNSVL